MRQRPDALVLIAVYEFVMAAMLLIAACVVLPIALLITPFASDSFGQFLGRFLIVALILTVVFGFGVASAMVGFGLLLLKEWARIGAILLAIPAIIGFPIWTVIAILIIVYLAGQEGRALFRHSRRAGMVSARISLEDANEEDLVNNSVSWEPPDPPAGAETIAAPEEPRANVIWTEPAAEAGGHQAVGEDVKKPPLD
jgi:hypothetical protein